MNRWVSLRSTQPTSTSHCHELSCRLGRGASFSTVNPTNRLPLKSRRTVIARESGGGELLGFAALYPTYFYFSLSGAQLKASFRTLSRCHPNPTIRKRPDRPATNAIQYSLKCIRIELTPMTGSSSSRTAGRNRGWFSIT